MPATGWYPLKIAPSFRERIWGREDLSDLYPSHRASSSRIGEVWLTADDNVIAEGPLAGKTLGELCCSCGPGLIGRTISPASAAAAFPLLVKFIFTSDKLSVQVHPSDDYAARVEGCSGKTEMWHVIKAERGAQLAVGFRKGLPPLSRDALVRATKTGEIEQMLNWTEVQAGDTFFVPAGAVHAIGAGLIICEIQQNSDLTYRLYDYNRKGSDGRPRELHLEKAVDVIQWQTRGGRTSGLTYDAAGSRECLAACRYFATEKLVIAAPVQLPTDGRFQILIGIQGEASLESNGYSLRLCSGEAAVIPAGAATFTINPVFNSALLRAYEPDLSQDILAPLGARGFSEEQLSQVCFPDHPLHPIETAE